MPQQLYTCIEAILVALQRDYGLARFSGVVQRLPAAAAVEGQGNQDRSPHCRHIEVALPRVIDRYSAVLMVYRQPETSAVVAIKVEVWQGSTAAAEIPLLDCQGLLPSQIHAYLNQVLALLNSRYEIRWFARQLEDSSESCLPLLEPAQPSDTADLMIQTTLDLDPLWHALEEELQQHKFAPVESLEVLAAGITAIVMQFTEFAALTFEELDSVAERGVELPKDALDRYVRQTMEVDFEPFIEPLVRLPRKTSERQEVIEGASVVGMLDQAAVLQALDQQMSQKPELTEVEIFNRTLAITHDEDVSAWAAAIAHWMRQHRSSLSLMDLVQAMQMPLLSVWLGVLLNDQFVVEQRGQFYELSSVWISVAYPSASLTS